ncbi:MAG: hypothetical protein A3H97_22935 [Acidobacteria bacterium RIFCSPLOWO2_02_FULL_65_29]|nr:MAG: hypothetical protein A3H97_22935 [Acidobacteria bacterium RIFCSPLOWO2_02_FULL_65_29]
MELVVDDNEPSWLEYFSGGVPTGEYFRMTLQDLRELATMETDEGWTGLDRVHQLCFIGLLCYFEAFCKDHFAALINIEPTLVSNLKMRGQDVAIDATDVLLYGGAIGTRVGFVLSEKYDFGTAQKINALFSALLRITPFGKDETESYALLLQDRNLLVHHGGTYTLSYLRQRQLLGDKLRNDAFYNSRQLASDDVVAGIAFIEAIARKLLSASHAALKIHAQAAGIVYSTERQKALDATLWWEDATA